MRETDSWRTYFEALRFSVDCPMTEYDIKHYFKGLASYPELISFSIARLERSLKLIVLY